MAKTALIFGVSGQDGAFLARSLLAKGYIVQGSSRDAEASAFGGLRALGMGDRVTVHSTALTAFRSVLQTISPVEPDEIYNLSGQSSVGLSFQQPVETLESVATATLRVLETMRFLGTKTRFYNGSSECFGNTGDAPASETTLPPAQPLRRRQGDRVLGGGQRPRQLRPVRLIEDPVQPRIAAAPGTLRHQQDRGGGGADRPRRRRQGFSRRCLDAARLGLGARIRRGDVDDCRTVLSDLSLLAIADVRLGLSPGKAAEIRDVSMPLRAS